MSKRVFELAKELNTTSKRLMEKLEEINVSVKSHMSLLEEDELNRLYKHIGIVNRNRVESSDDGVNVDQQEQADNQIRKSIPRIIRKTEIIIHDDDYEREMRDREKNKNKNKKNFVRTSSSTDGLMAGLARGNDHHTPSVRKHTSELSKPNDWPSDKKKPDESRATPDSGDEQAGMNRGDRIRRPMDNILSIKKVSSREEREKQSPDEMEVKQENALAAGLKPIGNEAENKTETEKQNTIGAQKETVSAGAEKSDDHMAINTQVTQQAKTEKAVESVPKDTVVNEGLQRPNKKEPSGDRPSEVSDKAEYQAKPSVRETPDMKEGRPEDSDRNRTRGNQPGQHSQMPREDRERGPRPNQQAGMQDREGQNRGMRSSHEREGMIRDGNREGNQNRSFNREGGQGGGYNREGGQGGYNRDGGQNRSYNREGGQAGGYNREGGQGG